MAFTYKNPLEIAVNKLPSKQSDQLHALTFDKIEKIYDQSNDLFSFSVTPEQQEILTREGLSLAAIPFKVHSHPVCKMIENHLLYVVIPSLLKNMKSVAFMSLREEKVEKFLKMFQVFKYGTIKNFKHYNAIIDGKDRFRYGDTPFSDFEDRVKGLKEECFKANKFPKVLLVHDELHHWGPEKVAKIFDEIPEIQQIVATTVFPIEILMGDGISREPRVYSFEISSCRENLFFFPDGRASEGYKQSIKTSEWPFRHSCIHSGRTNIRVSKLFSIFSHHVFSFDRGRQTQDELMFQKPSCLMNHELELITANYGDACIERRTLMSIITYLTCLKSANAASAVAKLRQLEKRMLLPDELSLVYSFADQLSSKGISDDLNIGKWRSIKRGLVSALAPSISDFFLSHEKFHMNIRSLQRVINIETFIIERKPLKLLDGKGGPERFLFSLKSKVMSTADESRGLFFCVHANDKHEKEKREELMSAYNLSKCEISKRFLLGYAEAGVSWTENLTGFRRAPTEIREFRGFSAELFTLNRDEITPFRICWRPECNRSDDRPAGLITSRVSSPSSLRGISVVLDDIECIDEPRAENFLDCTVDNAQTDGRLPRDELEMFKCFNLDVKAPKIKRRNDCVFRAIASFRGVHTDDIIDELYDMDISEELQTAIENDKGVDRAVMEEVGRLLNVTFVCTSDFKDIYFLNRRQVGTEQIFVTIRNNHCEISDKSLFLELLRQKEGVSKDSPSLFPEHLFSSSQSYICTERAMTLLKSFNRGTTGTLREIDPGFLSELMEKYEFLGSEKIPINLYTRFGFAGSGKTKAVIDWFKNTPGVRRLFISPRRNLADDVLKKIEGTSTVVCTYEVALKKVNDGFQEIYLDEITLYPRGYLSLLMLCKVKKRIKGASARAKTKSMKDLSLESEKVVLIGDPLQLTYFGQLDDNLLSKVNEIDYHKPKEFDYLWQTQRQGKWFKKVIDIPTNDEEGTFECRMHSDTSTLGSVDAIIVAAQEEKSNFSSSGKCMTIGESQGLTFNERIAIVISHNTLKTSPNACIVAITRSKKGYDLIFHGISPDEAKKLSMKSLWSFVIKKEQIPTSRLLNLLEGAKLSTEIAGSIEEKAKGDPFIMPFIDLSEDIILEEVEKEDVTEAPEWFKCHVPIFDCNPLIAEMFEKVEAKEKREFQSVLGMSNQFLDYENKSIKGSEVWPYQFQNIFPHHQSNDDVTFMAGVRKRIRKSSWFNEKRKLDALGDVGEKLLNVFLKGLPEKFEVTSDDIEFGNESFKRKRSEKSAILWERHSERSDIDWPIDHVFMFMKSQFCTKEAKMFTTAKAGQTLACFQHFVLFKFGPSLRAIERAFMRAIGDRYYIHSGKNFFSLDAFVLENQKLFQGESIESDYEAFDSCQDEVILAFELALLKKIGMSTSYILDYERLKLALGSKMGNFAIMRFTGEFSTFLFNTFANMLFTFLKYEVKKDDRILFAGDDMCSIGSLRKRSDGVERMLDLFSLKAVEEVKKYPMFCGWYLSPHGILKSPKLLWSRICMMKQRGLIERCIDNYLFEAFFAYRLSEKLYDILKEEDFEYHFLVVRFFVKNSKLLTGLSRSLIQEIGESIGCQSSMQDNSLKVLSQKTSRLMQSGHLTFIKTQGYTNQMCSIVSGGSKQTSKLLRKMGMEYACLTSSCLTRKKFSTLSKARRGINIFTLEQSLLASKQCSLTLGERKVKLLYTMGLALMRTKGKGSLLLSPLSLMETHAILSSDQSIFFQQLMHILDQLLSSRLELIAQDTERRGSSSPWTSEWRTECVIALDFLRLGGKAVGGFLNPFSDVKQWTLAPKFWKSWIFLKAISAPQMGHQVHCPRKGGLAQRRSVDRGLWLQKERKLSLLKIFLIMSKKESKGVRTRATTGGIIEFSGLQEKKKVKKAEGHFRESEKEESQVLLNLEETQLQVQIEEVLAPGLLEMSNLKAVLKEERRKYVLTNLWLARVNVGNNAVNEIVGVEDGVYPPNAVHKAAFERIMKHYCKFLFGNVAIFGASDKTIYPPVPFSTTPLAIRAPNAEQGRNLVWQINLKDVVAEIKAGMKASESLALRDATWRAVCESFAEEAYDYLKESAGEITTTIYDKWPRALSAAPWVAFDFNAGLDKRKLTDDEKRVIDVLTRRLFRTQGQAAVFKAGSEIDSGLEG